jgi:hypothetical protein
MDQRLGYEPLNGWDYEIGMVHPAGLEPATF